MFPEYPSPVCPVKAVPVMAIGKIRERVASCNNSFTVIAVGQTCFDDTPEGIKPWIDLIKSFHFS
jgi:hypothetical protein